MFVRLSRFMLFYDSLICPQDYSSVTAGPPDKAMAPYYELIAASENGSTTVVEFSRDAVTVDEADYVQFKVRLHPNVKCFILFFSKRSR